MSIAIHKGRYGGCRTIGESMEAAQVADWIAMVSGVVAAVGLLFTGYQVWLLNRQARHDRRVVLDGVAVSWRPVEAPSQAERADGMSKWLYELVLVNPGRLPIDDVQIRWTFPCHVVRLRHDGISDSPTATLTLSVPVVVGGGERTWRRNLLIDYGKKHDLFRTYAEVTFNDIDGRRRTNRWPRNARQPLHDGSSAAKS
jgi:hypothetical protein